MPNKDFEGVAEVLAKQKGRPFIPSRVRSQPFDTSCHVLPNCIINLEAPSLWNQVAALVLLIIK